MRLNLPPVAGEGLPVRLSRREQFIKDRTADVEKIDQIDFQGIVANMCVLHF